MSTPTPFILIKRILLVEVILSGLMLQAAAESSKAVKAPEIVFLERYQELQGNNKGIERLFQDATFLEKPQAAHNLLDYLHDVNKLEEVRLVHKVVERMTCRPEEIVIARLRAETDPWQKYKLLRMIVSFYQQNVFKAFYEQIDDTGFAEHPDMYDPRIERRTPLRVRDYAYLALTGRLKGLGYLPPETLFKDFYQYPYSGRTKEAFAQRDVLIAEFKKYWEANQEQIFKELPERIEALDPNSKKRIRYSQPDKG